MSLVFSAEGELEDYLSHLSNSRFRLAGDCLCQRIMPQLNDSDFWHLAIRLTRYNNKAFLGSVLKSLSAHPRDLHHRCLCQWAAGMTTLDRHKTLLTLLPQASTPQSVSSLLETFGIPGATLGHGHDIDYLISAATPASFFVLMGYMRLREYDKSFLTVLCRRIMKRADGISFNAASLFKVFFDLPDVHGTFSLRIQPYELGRLETDFALFSAKISTNLC